MYRKSSHAIASELGERLKRARLNSNVTQQELADRLGLSRKTILNAEKGQSTLVVFIAIMVELEIDNQLDLFLPHQLLSPKQLYLLQGKVRQRASGNSSNNVPDNEEEDDLGW